MDGKADTDPDRRADHHGEEQQDQLQAVPGPAEATSPQLVQVRLNLHNRIYSDGLHLMTRSYSCIGDDSLLITLDQHIQERNLSPVHRLQNLPCDVSYYKPSSGLVRPSELR